MTLSMYQISVPVFTRHLKGLATCLNKTRAVYTEKKLDEGGLLSYRLYPDMFNFVRQVQAATEHARTCTAMLSGVEAPALGDGEASIADLVARVEKAIGFLESIKPEQVDGTEDKQITIKMRDREVSMTGAELLLNRAMPNFYFHATTAYDIMRHNGIEVGKRDFMGAT